MIQIKNLKKSFNNVTVVDVVSLNIEEGELVGLIGNNGAGKSTLFRLILDLMKPDIGSVLSNSIIVQRSDEWKSYTGSFLGNSQLISFLKPSEYFEFLGMIYGIKWKEVQNRLENYEEFIEKELVKSNQLIRQLSDGNKQKIGIMGAILFEPKVIILDEPFNYLDPTSQMTLTDILSKLKSSSDKAIIISSHNLSNLSQVCSRFIIMETGKIVYDNLVNEVSISFVNNYFTRNSALLKPSKGEELTL